jgi:hypothetical protein
MTEQNWESVVSLPYARLGQVCIEASREPGEGDCQEPKLQIPHIKIGL